MKSRTRTEKVYLNEFDTTKHAEQSKGGGINNG